MKSSSISVSNSMVLSLRQWLITILSVVLISGIIYYGWSSWEHYAPGPDHRETCWAERQSDYWAYMRWIRKAGEKYKVFLVGDSVIWGQEVRNDETISHYLNEFYGKEIFANLGNDGFFMAGMPGFVKYYGDYLDNTNIVLQLNPLWISSPRRDLRVDKSYGYHHPRLIPQFSCRIAYHHDFNQRLGFQFEHYIRLFPFMRHLMVNYFDNKSISGWIMDNPYNNPFAAITFESTPVMAEIQGMGVDWKTKGMKMSDDPFLNIHDSVQWDCYLNALKELKKKNAKVFILIGPFNTYCYTPESRERLFSMIDDIKENLDSLGYPYFDSLRINLPSETFGDTCHLLKEGHILLAKALNDDTRFRQWLKEIDR